MPTFFANGTIVGGPAPVRAYIEELMPDILESHIDPGYVFDRVTDLMNEREAIKVMIAF